MEEPDMVVAGLVRRPPAESRGWCPSWNRGCRRQSHRRRARLCGVPHDVAGMLHAKCPGVDGCCGQRNSQSPVPVFPAADIFVCDSVNDDLFFFSGSALFPNDVRLGILGRLKPRNSHIL